MLEDLALLPTLSEDELASTLSLSRAGLSELARTFERSPRSTIEPPNVHASTAGRRALEALQEKRVDGDVSGAIEMGDTIGEGGMGVVRMATQRSLGRRVAVKTLRADTKDERATLRLLREAWVTGALEHPNIVPVYDLGLGADGTPIIVLKRIEGRPWSDVLAESKATTDGLEQNLRILVQLCNAVSLAHSRGILHRDLKPENVMIGGFGEVYLVDWGIAVSLREDPSGRLPHVRDARELAGTPSYMAPEMLGGGQIEERTDVYLLGAILHEILVGRPPHVGDNFQQILASIVRSTATLPNHVPAELAAIVHKAMSRRIEDRFGSAEALRDRIEWYLRHRGSLALSAEAARRVDELRAVLEQGEAPERGEDEASVRERVHRLFAEARFGFRQAMVASVDNDVARAGLRNVTEMVVAFELESGTPEAAAAALAEIDAPSPELAQRVADAMKGREEEKARVARLEKLSADFDPTTGRRTRMVVGALLGIVWAAAPVVFWWMFRDSAKAPKWLPYASTGTIIAFALGLFAWGRDTMSKTIVNRRVTAFMLVMFASVLMTQLGGDMLGVSLVHTLTFYILVWFVSAASITVFVERLLWPTSLAYLAAFMASCVAPRFFWAFMSASNLVCTANVLVAWARPSEDSEFFVMRIRQRQARRRARRAELS